MKMHRLAFGLLVLAGLAQGASSGAQETAPTLTVYKSPTCGCCSKWIEHMRSQGFEVKATDVEDINAVKTAHGVPAAAASCHTALVRGYVVEGHVPASAVQRMLRDQPKIAGLAVPGMPVGAPGMEMPGGQVDKYDVVSFEKGGKTAVYEKH